MAEEKIRSVEEIVGEAWDSSSRVWNYPSVSKVIAADSSGLEGLGEVGELLRAELAFMKYPEFQTYANLDNIREKFSDFERGLNVVFLHELGHRFCPYDGITSFILAHKAEHALKEVKVKYDAKSASRQVLNLFSDTCINTSLVRKGIDDFVWAYEELSKGNDSAFWRVYAGSLERIWDKKILSDGVVLSDTERKAAEDIAGLFRGNVLEMDMWEKNIGSYARLIAPFFEEKAARQAGLSQSASGNIPNNVSAEEIARRVAKSGNNGLPTNSNAVRDFRDLMAGFGYCSPVFASIAFYEHLARAYGVRFASRPFGRPRSSPFSLDTWCASDPVDELDVAQSIMNNGVVIPGVTASKWKSRVTNVRGGEREVVPCLDIYLDSSGSMVNPVEQFSLPVLACFVAAQKARYAGIRAVNFDGRVVAECSRTKDLKKAYEVLVAYGGGGTVFPAEKLLENPEQDPRLALIVTDTFLANKDAACSAIRNLKARNKHNRVAVYAITAIPDSAELKEAGAVCIQGTTAKIFDYVLGEAEKVYK